MLRQGRPRLWQSWAPNWMRVSKSCSSWLQCDAVSEWQQWVASGHKPRYGRTMTLAPRIVLHSPIADGSALGPFVEQCLADGVCLIAIVGEGAEALEEEVDWLVIGDGADKSRF